MFHALLDMPILDAEITPHLDALSRMPRFSRQLLSHLARKGVEARQRARS